MREIPAAILKALEAVQAQQVRQQKLLEQLAGSTAGAFAPLTPPEEVATVPPLQPPTLLTRADLRKFYNVTYSREHISRLVAKGKVPPPLALGESIYSRKVWRRDDVENFIANRPVFDAAFKRAAPQIKGKKSA